MFTPIEPKPEAAEAEEAYQRLLDRMRASLTAVRDLPGLDTLREHKQLPAAFFEHFNAFLAAYDEMIDLALGYAGDDTRIKCSKGCANCCIDLVRGVTTAEIANIYHHVRLWPDCKQLFEYHRESAETFTEILLKRVNPTESPPAGDDPRIAESHVEFNQLNRRCGFLDAETGCCRIYSVRPISCRYFFSFDEPETCSPLHVKYLNRSTRTVHLPQDLHLLLREINAKFKLMTLNYLSGAFCQFTAEVMRLKPIEVVDDGSWPPAAQPPATSA